MRLRTAAITLPALGLAFALGWLLPRPAPVAAQPDADSEATGQGNVVRQGFPASAARADNLPASDSAWEIQWEITHATNRRGYSSPPASVLKIVSAKFMHKDAQGQPRWLTVLRNLELGECFVPYDPGFPRFRDVANHAFWILPADPKLLGPGCVALGEVLSSDDPNMTKKVYKEVHDDGLRWLADGDGRSADRGRRGEKMTLWAVFYGANYRYIIEYGFSDDGTISARVGATARNLLPRQPDGGDTHLHMGCWLFEPKLSDPTDPATGPSANRVQLVRRIPQVYGLPEGRYRIDTRPFGTPPGTPVTDPAFEGSAEWLAEEFTLLRIESQTRKNRQPTPLKSAYDLMAVRTGTSRNFPPELEFANKDFWVTGELSVPIRYHEVPQAVATPPRAINGKPVTVYHTTPLLHVVRSEDLNPNGISNYPHVALTSWAGFMLKPRNVFDGTPLFTPLQRREED